MTACKILTADSLGFLNLPGSDPEVKRPLCADFMHVTSVPPPVSNAEDAYNAHCAFRDIITRDTGTRIVRRQADLHSQRAGTGIIFGMQHTPEGITLPQLRKFSGAGVRIMALAYKGDTEYGGGYASKIGLTLKGKKLLEWMAMSKIIPDLSHNNQQTAEEALEFIWNERIVTHPMLSHSGCYAIYPHARNVPDEVLKGVALLGGYVGIPAITFFLHSKHVSDAEYFERFAQHVAHAVRVCGAEHVGIGSDSVYRNIPFQVAQDHFAIMERKIGNDAVLAARFPDRPIPLITEGSKTMEHLRTALDLPGLLKLHAHEKDALCGANFVSYLESALPRT